MHPRDTSYDLAHTLADYQAAHRFMRQEGAEGAEERLSFPTVLARREGRVVGLLSTAIYAPYIVATNLVLAKTLPRPLLLAIRLFERYEAVLRQAGVTSYLFELVGQATPLQGWFAALGLRPYAVDGTSAWYQRHL